jgi:hypothetical protein
VQKREHHLYGELENYASFKKIPNAGRLSRSNSPDYKASAISPRKWSLCFAQPLI